MSDLLMWVGEEHYPWPHHFTDEVDRVGLSKRVPATAIPLIEPGITRLAVIHPKAVIVQGDLGPADGACLGKLAEELEIPLVEDGEEWLATDLLRRGLARLEAEDPEEFERLTLALDLRFEPGIFGYVWLTGIQYVCRAGESDAPEELKALGVEPVRVVRGEMP